MQSYREQRKCLERSYGAVYRFPDENQWTKKLSATTGQWILCPPFASEEEAHERAEREQNNTIRHVRFQAAHGNEWPLWETETHPLFPYGPTEPGDYNVSDCLARELHQWCGTWLRLADQDLGDGLPLEGILPRQWWHQGKLLVRRLAQELWPIADVVYRYRGAALA